MLTELLFVVCVGLTSYGIWAFCKIGEIRKDANQTAMRLKGIIKNRDERCNRQAIEINLYARLCENIGRFEIEEHIDIRHGSIVRHYAVVGFDADGGNSKKCVIKEFYYKNDDDDDRDFARREAEELIEDLKG